MTPLLEFRRVGKRFGVVHALSEVTLPIRAGEILALVGENGAGKSTLTRIMEGVHRPDTGEVVIDGAPVLLRAPAEAHAAGIRVIHQEPDIFPDLSVAKTCSSAIYEASRAFFSTARILRFVRETC